MNDQSPKQVKKKKTRGFLNPKVVRAVTFYIISACIIFSVAVCILAIWDYAKTDVFWRMIATLGVIAIGSAVFAFVNGIFGIEED
jgi:nucleoside recognition membrane protein YjiH